MANNLVSARIPKEFWYWITELSKEQSIQSGDAASKNRILRLLHRDLSEHLIYRNGKFEYAIVRWSKKD